MKRHIRYVALVFSALFLFVSTNIGSAYNTINEQQPVSDSLWAYSEQFNTDYNKLVEYWGSYPDYYGGMYMQSEKLYILLTDNNPDIISEICNVISTDNAVFVEVKYSMNYLQEVCNNLSDLVFNEEKRKDDIRLQYFVGLGIDEAENCVLMEVMEGKLTESEVKEIIGEYPCVRISFKSEA